jgi:hypothetical protein
MALVCDWRLDRSCLHHVYRHWQHGGSKLAAATRVWRHSAGDVAVALERRSTSASDLLIVTALIWTLPLLLGIVGAVVKVLLEAR